MLEIISVLSLLVSFLLLFIFIAFIKNTREKILKLSEDLQDYNVKIEQSINTLISDVNKNNTMIHTHEQIIENGSGL